MENKCTRWGTGLDRCVKKLDHLGGCVDARERDSYAILEEATRGNTFEQLEEILTRGGFLPLDKTAMR